MHTNIPGRNPIELPAFYESFAWYYPDCEMQTKDWFVRHAQPDWIYVDCGANIGYYSILFSQLSPQGRVHAVEPTATADMLEKNLRHHGCANVRVHRLALAADAGRRQESIYRLWGGLPDVGDYDFTTVDLLVESLGPARVDCLKIDVDSFDFEVIRGAARTLERFDPWIIVELSENLSLRNASPAMVFSWLEAHGYRAGMVLDQENFLFKRAWPDERAAIPIAVLRWAGAQDCLHVLRREMLQVGRSPAWVCSDYAAQAAMAAADDVEFCRSLRDIPAAAAPAGQLLQYAALVRHFSPDVIVELGGWQSVTTAALAFGLPPGGDRRIFSWRTNASPPASADHRVAMFPSFPSPEELRAPLRSARRVLVFSNDPSPEATQLLLCVALPELRVREHLVVVHGISDGHVSVPPTYAERPGVFALHNTWSSRADLPPLLDFITRNQLDLFSAGRAYRVAFAADEVARTRVRCALGATFPFDAHWAWFSCNGRHNLRELFPLSP